jgi:hypothetical protein
VGTDFNRLRDTENLMKRVDHGSAHQRQARDSHEATLDPTNHEPSSNHDPAAPVTPEVRTDVAGLYVVHVTIPRNDGNPVGGAQSIARVRLDDPFDCEFLFGSGHLWSSPS